MNSFCLINCIMLLIKINRNTWGIVSFQRGRRRFKLNQKHLSLSSQCRSFKKYEFRRLKASITWNVDPPYKYANKRLIMDFLFHQSGCLPKCMDTVQIQARIFVSVQKIIKYSKTYEYVSHNYSDCFN